MADIERVILRRLASDAPSGPEIADSVVAGGGISLVDAQAGSLLVEGDPVRIAANTRGIAGWTAYPSRSIPLPDSRPKVGKPARP